METRPGVDAWVSRISAAFAEADDARQDPRSIARPHHQTTTAVTLCQEDAIK